MSQLSILSHDINYLTINIDYDGYSSDLQRHEIDAKSYAISVGGYTKFLYEFISGLLGKNVEIYVVANKEGSFKSVLKIAWNVVAGYSVITGALTFHGIAHNTLKSLQYLFKKKLLT